MKRITCLVILFSMLLAFSAFAYADNANAIPLTCVVDKYQIQWGSHIEDLPDDLQYSVSQNELPFWGDPTKTADYLAGFVVSLRNLSHFLELGPFYVEDVNLYYTKQFDIEGYVDDIGTAQLYMAEYTIGRVFSISKDDINRFIDENTKKFGEPLLIKKTTKSQINHGNGWETAKTRHRDYVWTASGNTAIRLKYDYESWSERYTDVIIYIGRTDFDQSIKAGKLSSPLAFIQVTVADKPISFFDKDGTHLLDLKKGTELLLTNYDSDSDMFCADVVVSDSSFVASGDYSFFSSGWASEYDGFVTGKGLSISRKDLLQHFADSYSPVSTQAPTPEPSPTPTPAPETTPEVKVSSSVFYSTNDKDTVKKGNRGIYSYIKRGSSYSVYYIIDFDTGYVYYFTEGNSNSICERVKIEEGDLNNVLIITYHDGKDKWSYGLHFKWKNQPDHLVVEDERGDEWDLKPTNLDEALRLKGQKTIVDY